MLKTLLISKTTAGMTTSNEETSSSVSNECKQDLVLNAW